MVAVFVRDQDAGEIFRHATNVLKTLADLARAEPGIHEDAGFIGFDVGAIAAGSAAENGEFDGHAWTLVAWKQRGKLFSIKEAGSKIQLCVLCDPGKPLTGGSTLIGVVVSALCADSFEPQARRYSKLGHCPTGAVI